MTGPLQLRAERDMAIQHANHARRRAERAEATASLYAHTLQATGDALGVPPNPVDTYYARILAAARQHASRRA